MRVLINMVRIYEWCDKLHTYTLHTCVLHTVAYTTLHTVKCVLNLHGRNSILNWLFPIEIQKSCYNEVLFAITLTLYMVEWVTLSWFPWKLKYETNFVIQNIIVWTPTAFVFFLVTGACSNVEARGTTVLQVSPIDQIVWTANYSGACAATTRPFTTSTCAVCKIQLESAWREYCR